MKFRINFYKRKLATYNFTVFDLRTKEGSCYMWDESVAKRGSSEIASCLWLWLEHLPATVKRVTLYSDSCSGQNRNINMTGMMLAAVNCLPLEQIDHKFPQSGHTEMEVDCMHAVVERKSHSAEIFVPRDWVTIASVAKTSGQPYRVRTMTNSDFIDFKSVSFKTTTDLTVANGLTGCTVSGFSFAKAAALLVSKMNWTIHHFSSCVQQT